MSSTSIFSPASKVMPACASAVSMRMRRLMVDQEAVDHRLAIASSVKIGSPKICAVWSAGVAVSPILTASKYSSTRRYFEM